ncbi:hypothetical protein SDC9_148568 [bioreactor metagenome]|uniref:Uncharacterized protein n=1 Tax=bioreactor metagenome TaxID=1076179 RepID=A0A645EJP8_9ZZZZ
MKGTAVYADSYGDIPFLADVDHFFYMLVVSNVARIDPDFCYTG